jgi:zinc protease
MKRLLPALLIACFSASAFAGPDYAVVVSKATHADADWSKVVDILVKKHNASVIVYDQSVDEALPALKKQFPRYTCFVTKPEDAERQFVAQVHQLTRTLDSDPYTDTFWGILTGYDATNALVIASHSEPLVVKKVASGTEFATEMVTEGQWYDELVRNKHVKKEPGGKAQQLKGPDDTTRAIVNLLNDYKPDLMITSGHATEANWMIGFRFRSGFFKSEAGQMYGEDTNKQRIEIDSKNPKVYMPIGNCLMGHINGPDAMALAWMNDVGVKQMIGYTIPSGYGYGGWGCLDYFVEQPGRYTFNEAFLANHHALIHRMNADDTSSGDKKRLQGDRDVVTFYGDPKWSAKMANRPKYYDQALQQDGDIYTLTITPKRGKDSFSPVNTNGSERGWRPIIQFLPHRVMDAQIIVGEDLKPVITDDFILVPNPRQCDPDRAYVVKFKAKQISGVAAVNDKPISTWPPHIQKDLYAANDYRGEKAPKFVVEDWANGEPTLKGKILLVDFWATWCGPCRGLIPHMNELHEKYKNDIAVIGLSDQKADVISEFLAKTKVDYPMAVDTKAQMKGALDVKSIPAS